MSRDRRRISPRANAESKRRAAPCRVARRVCYLAPPRRGGGPIMRILYAALCGMIALAPAAARAKDTVRIAFVGPLTGGNSAIGLGGRNSADLAVKLRNQDAKAKYQYDLVVLDDES